VSANPFSNGLRRVGAGTLRAIARTGYLARFFLAVLVHTPTAFLRIRLTLREIYFSGVLSLVVIMVSGLFVGMVLGLQGYDTLNRYGAGDSLGIFVGLSLVRELGPVVSGLLFASRAGSAVTAEIGLMKTTEQLSAMEMMAVDPLARIVAPPEVAPPARVWRALQQRVAPSSAAPAGNFLNSLAFWRPFGAVAACLAVLVTAYAAFETTRPAPQVAESAPEQIAPSYVAVLADDANQPALVVTAFRGPWRLTVEPLRELTPYEGKVFQVWAVEKGSGTIRPLLQVSSNAVLSQPLGQDGWDAIKTSESLVRAPWDRRRRRSSSDLRDRCLLPGWSRWSYRRLPHRSSCWRLP
jgi:anti-sigma-K factor RskA